MGINFSRLCDRRAYHGRIDDEYRMRAPSAASRSHTRGWRIATWFVADGPLVGRLGLEIGMLCEKPSNLWVSSARAPLRRTSVRESVKAPGWVRLITLLSDTAYHSFIGEVEALNTTTMRRLTHHAVTNF
jgi:hypothetical protein